MRICSSLLLALLGALLVVACGGGDKSPAASQAPTATTMAGEPPAASPGASEPVVYLIGLEDFPEETLVRLQAFFRDEHDISVGVLPSIPIDNSTYDPQRQQLVADRLLDTIGEARGPQRDVVVIGLTGYDIMMLDRPDWAFVFSLRDDAAGLAVVSTARMDPVNFGERPDDDLLFERASKMVGKNIGVMHVGLPMSSDPRSVMYDRLTSLTALDAVDDDFRLVAP